MLSRLTLYCCVWLRASAGDGGHLPVHNATVGTERATAICIGGARPGPGRPARCGGNPQRHWAMLRLARGVCAEATHRAQAHSTPGRPCLLLRSHSLSASAQHSRGTFAWPFGSSTHAERLETGALQAHSLRSAPFARLLLAGLPSRARGGTTTGRAAEQPLTTCTSTN